MNNSFPKKLVLAVKPENPIGSLINPMKIEIKTTDSTSFEFYQYNNIKTLRHTINDLLEHLEFAYKTWLWISEK